MYFGRLQIRKKLKMIKILLFIKHKCGFIWTIVEWFNSLLFGILYSKKLSLLQGQLDVVNRNSAYKVELLGKEDMQPLAAFFTKQPEEYFGFFKPHKFDHRSLLRKNREKSFIMIGVRDGNSIIGYGFLRCFINGKSFRGKMVDVDYQGKGIAKQLGVAMTFMAEVLNLRLYATISKDNVKSIASSKAVNNIRIIKELPDNYLYVEYLRK